MCFSPQRRANFEHLNFEKCSEPLSFLANSLQNVLLATTACNFSTSQLQKVVRSWCVLYIFTSKCASRHSGVQFLISPLTTWLCTRRFNEPTFRLTRHTHHWKNTAFRDFSNIWRGCIFFLLTFGLSRYCIFFLLTLLHLLTLLSCDFTSSFCFSSAFQLSILSEVYYLNFLRQVPLLTRCGVWSIYAWALQVKRSKTQTHDIMKSVQIHVSKWHSSTDLVDEAFTSRPGFSSRIVPFKDPINRSVWITLMFSMMS